jgi:hypothetical protein
MKSPKPHDKATLKHFLLLKESCHWSRSKPNPCSLALFGTLLMMLTSSLQNDFLSVTSSRPVLFVAMILLQLFKVLSWVREKSCVTMSTRLKTKKLL